MPKQTAPPVKLSQKGPTQRETNKANNAVVRERQKALKAALKENKKKASGEQALSDLHITFDADAWDDVYRAKLVAAGFPPSNIQQRSNPYSATISFRQTRHTLLPSMELQSESTDLPLLVLIVSKAMITQASHGGMEAYLREVVKRNRVVVVLEGCGAGAGSSKFDVQTRLGFNGAVSANLVSVQYCTTKAKTGEFLAGFCVYVAHAPFRSYNKEGKVFAEKTPTSVMHRMLSFIPSVGKSAVTSITSVHPTLTQIMHAYKASLEGSEDAASSAAKTLLQDIEIEEDGQGRGRQGVSQAVYSSLVLGSVLGAGEEEVQA